ncbi:hypothetical protein FSP39_023841 [Pinctada imbricata]|uniref:Uncharacterized protein n=1 Tax=Pinctada imbricata TaxID=66713 RepID=A0AA88YM12_PINIB|nr:hypothetical protein FSP39_023841 [Pinctada imbricata]
MFLRRDIGLKIRTFVSGATAPSKKDLSNVGSSTISSVMWPFRFCDVIKVETCEEVVGDDVWNTIISRNNDSECRETWNCTLLKQCRDVTEERSIGTVQTLARNLIHVLLMKHFEGQYLAHQGISLRPFEIYVAPGGYVKYNPQIDVCLSDPLDTGILCLNILQAGSKQNVQDCMYQTMFSTLSGHSATAYCFVIKASSDSKFEVYLGRICWPRRMKQMMLICGSDVSRQLGFNHHKHNQRIHAKYCCIGEISLSEDDSPTVKTFLNTVLVLSLLQKQLFLPLSAENSNIIEKRKLTGKHFAKCILNETEICNERFDECSFRENT